LPQLLEKPPGHVRPGAGQGASRKPGGGGGAKRTVDCYKSKGVAEDRLLILEKGMDAWPYEKEAK